MKLTSIKEKIRELTNVNDFELVEATRGGKLELGEFCVLGLQSGHFAAVNKATAEVTYYAADGAPDPTLFEAQIEALFTEKIAEFHGALSEASYVYILEKENPPFKADLKAKRDHYQHLSSFDVTWIKAPSHAYTQLVFKSLYKPGTRYLVLGDRTHEIEPIGPNFVRRKSIKDWHVNMRSDFIEINALGSTPEAFYYSSNYKNGVLKMPISHPKSHIMTLAPLKYWQDMGIFWRTTTKGREYLCFEAIRNYLMEKAAKVGTYSSSNMLSSGYYWNNEIKRCYARSGFITYGVAPSGVDHSYGRYIYVPKLPERRVRIEFLREIFDTFCWSEPYMGRVLLGWVLLAPFCGALEFRPHCWINGETSAGKTWIFENVVCSLLGSLYCGFTMGTTEAGLIRGLQGMALPVVHDEFESDQNFKKSAKMSLIEFFRGCSTSAGDKMSLTKGMQGGNSTQSFKSSCMAVLGSIKNCLDTPQDAARFLMLSLDKKKRKTEFQTIRHRCEGCADELHDMFKVHIDTAFHKFGAILHNIKYYEEKIKGHYPELNHHSARCIAGINGILKFYNIEFDSNDIKKIVDNYQNYVIRESDNILDDILLESFWHDGQNRNLLYYIRGAVRRMGKSDGIYDVALKWHGIKIDMDGSKVNVVFNSRNRMFNHNVAKKLGARNWRQLLLNEGCAEQISERSFIIKDLFSYIGGVDGNNKGKESEQA